MKALRPLLGMAVQVVYREDMAPRLGLIIATTATLTPMDVEHGGVPPLSSPLHVHLFVFPLQRSVLHQAQISGKNMYDVRYSPNKELGTWSYPEYPLNDDLMIEVEHG